MTFAGNYVPFVILYLGDDIVIPLYSSHLREAQYWAPNGSQILGIICHPPHPFDSTPLLIGKGSPESVESLAETNGTIVEDFLIILNGEQVFP